MPSIKIKEGGKNKTAPFETRVLKYTAGEHSGRPIGKLKKRTLTNLILIILQAKLAPYNVDAKDFGKQKKNGFLSKEDRNILMETKKRQMLDHGPVSGKVYSMKFGEDSEVIKTNKKVELIVKKRN